MFLNKIYNKLKNTDLLLNYFKENNKKKALFTYITHPFLDSNRNQRHNNIQEAIAIAECLSSLSFNVDIINYDSQEKINYEKYDLIIGFGEPLINFFYSNTNKKVKTIYYGTGSHVFFQNTESIKRLLEVRETVDSWLPNSCRIVDKAWSIQTTCVDAMICLGNEFVLNTYRSFFSGIILQQPVSYISHIDKIKIKPIEERVGRAQRRKSFLWFSGGGAIHKGLDLLLEFFALNLEYDLVICGPVLDEVDFVEVFRDKLFSCKNIYFKGNVDVGSSEFKSIIESCLFIILPSCSEGQSGAVINCMALGMIPVISVQSGIDCRDFGVIIESLSVNSIKNSILKTDAFNALELIDMSNRSKEYALKFHSLEKYKSSFKRNIQRVIEL